MTSLCLGLWGLLFPARVASTNNSVELVGIVSPQLSINAPSTVGSIKVQLQPNVLSAAKKSTYPGNESRIIFKVMEIAIQMNGERPFTVGFEPVKNYLESSTGDRIPYTLGVSTTESQPDTFSTQEQAQIRITSQGQQLRLRLYLQLENTELQAEQTYQSEIMLNLIDQ